MEIVVSKIKLFILSFGKCKIFQTDNGLKFKNKELIVPLENEGIKFVLNLPRHPQTNGYLEALQK